MHISSKSWHLRLVRKVWEVDYAPKSLCPYFWTVVATILVTLFLGAAAPIWYPTVKMVKWGSDSKKTIQTFERIGIGLKAIAVGGGIIVLIAAIGYGGFLLYLLAILIWQNLLTSLWVALGVLTGLGVVIFLGFVGSLIGDKLSKRPRKIKEGKVIVKKEPKAPKEPSLFLTWLKAKKQKVCPLITVVEKA